MTDYFALPPYFNRRSRHWEFAIESSQPATLNCIADCFEDFEVVDALWFSDDLRRLIVQLSPDVPRDEPCARFAVGGLMTALETQFAPKDAVWRAFVNGLDFDAVREEGWTP